MEARKTTEDDVVALYGSFFGRAPESEAAIRTRLGRPLHVVAVEFARSQEFLRRELLQAETIRALYCSLFPTSTLPDAWFEWFCKIMRIHGPSLGQLVAYFHQMALHAHHLSEDYPEVAQSLNGTKPQLRNFGSNVTVVVPTINSANWIGHLIDHYLELGVHVVFAVDARSTDDTKKVLRKKGSEHFEIRGEYPRVESLIPDIVSKIKTQWILRLDDDEVPSPALLTVVDKAVEGSTELTWGFPRVYLRYEKTSQEVQYSQFLPISPIGGADRQWRLFSNSGVKLADTLHTPGFIANIEHQAPADAILFHFDWVIRPLRERLKKVKSYEAQDRMQARALAHMCLYEMVPESWHMFTKLAYQPYIDLASKLFHASAHLPSV